MSVPDQHQESVPPRGPTALARFRAAESAGHIDAELLHCSADLIVVRCTVSGGSGASARALGAASPGNTPAAIEQAQAAALASALRALGYDDEQLDEAARTDTAPRDDFVQQAGAKLADLAGEADRLKTAFLDAHTSAALNRAAKDVEAAVKAKRLTTPERDALARLFAERRRQLTQDLPF